ncbi:hypothetical protein SAMN05661096_03571 [Marivirga sericea]|uniref:Uncharacterized protein n=1 Tax=Marivirga sericea TaxID=1028 RepID=A0A1X7L5K9_9BACT|nr:hypothetical protein [Marivirga sericea]SMG49156.1 hypothetical protein SAMN05661096_03571 [Marivirga sericea]
MLNRILISSLIAISLSCVSKQSNEYKLEQLSIRPFIKDSIKSFLDDQYEFTSRSIGEFGTKSEQYERIKWLISQMSEKEFIELIETDHSLLKTLGFLGLYRTGSDKTSKYLIPILSDTSSYVQSTSGCMTNTISIPEFILIENFSYPKISNPFIDKHVHTIDSLIIKYDLNVRTKLTDS